MALGFAHLDGWGSPAATTGSRRPGTPPVPASPRTQEPSSTAVQGRWPAPALRCEPPSPAVAGDTTNTTDGHRSGVRWQFVARPLPPLEEKTVSTLTTSAGWSTPAQPEAAPARSAWPAPSPPSHPAPLDQRGGPHLPVPAKGKDACPELRKRSCALGRCCGDVLSARTVKDVRGVLCSALNHAATEELVTRNPAALVKLPPVRRRRGRVWTSDEARRFLESARLVVRRVPADSSVQPAQGVRCSASPGTPSTWRRGSCQSAGSCRGSAANCCTGN